MQASLNNVNFAASLRNSYHVREKIVTMACCSRRCAAGQVHVQFTARRSRSEYDALYRTGWHDGSPRITKGHRPHSCGLGRLRVPCISVWVQIRVSPELARVRFVISMQIATWFLLRDIPSEVGTFRQKVMHRDKQLISHFGLRERKEEQESNAQKISDTTCGKSVHWPIHPSLFKQNIGIFSLETP